MVTFSLPPRGGASRVGAILLLATLASIAALLASAPHAARADASPRSAASDEVLVHYRGQAGEQRVGVPAGQSVADALARLRSDPQVGYARPDYLVHAAAFWPNDPGSGGHGGWYQDQWNFLAPPQPPGGIDVPGAWRQLKAEGRPGGKGVTVAVLDTGIAYRKKGHRYRRDPDLPRTKRFVHPKSYVGHGRLPLDKEGHGTHVAGTIAQSTDNGRGLTGIAYGVKLMPIRVLNRHEKGKGSDVARGIKFATAHGADVINLSLDFKPDVRHCEQIVNVCHAIQHAVHAGVTVVAAAGNDNLGQVAYPAAARGVVAVGASTYRGCDADYSDYGRKLDLVAPGGGTDRTVAATGYLGCQPGAPGWEIRQYSLRPGPARRGNFRKFGITDLEGTSMSAAHASGVAALVLASRVCGKHPSPRRIRRRLKATAVLPAATANDDFYGAGLLNAARAVDPGIACAG